MQNFLEHSFNQLGGFSNIHKMSLLICLLLLLSSFILWLMSHFKPGANLTELKQRINSWWIMAGIFLVALLVNPKAAIIIFAFVSFLALKEYFTLIHTRFEDHRILFWSYVAIPIQYYWIFSGWKAMFLIFIPVYVFLFNPIRRLLTGQSKGMIESMSTIHWGLMLFVYCISHVAGLLTLPATPSIPGGGAALLLYLVFLTEINDVAQYIWGKSFGKSKIAPSISPKKTWAGFLGGVVTTIGLSLALRFLSGFNIAFSIWAGLIIGVAGFMGDLVISAVKRDVGVKDSSNLIPGHGGIMDRVDSLTYTAPLFFHFVSYFFYHAPVACSMQ